jgi:hypothetical protein
MGVGNGSTGVTLFPDGTNDAATWDPGTVKAVGAADGTEQAAKGHQDSTRGSRKRPDDVHLRLP